jgi:hypothetical protein
MALVSPGVQVTVIDQSNYAPSALGSVAYVLVATATNKVAPGGTGYAAGTLPENAEKIYTITSQRDLVTTFGTPVFQTTAGGAPINGDEQNEYGLLAAYSALGVSNTIYVQRANVDLASLGGSTSRPLADPSNGNLWLDTSTSVWGINEWNATTQDWVRRSPNVITSTDNLATDDFTPNVNYGSIGDYVVNAYNPYNPVFYKRYDNTWHLIGSPGWQSSRPAVVGSATNPVLPSGGTILINGTSVILAGSANVTTVASTINSAGVAGILARVVNNQLALYANSAAVGSACNVQNSSGTALTTLGITVGVYPAPAVAIQPSNQVPEWQGNAFVGKPSGSVWQKATALGSGMSMDVKEYSSTTDLWSTKTVNGYANVFAATYGLDPTGGGLNVTQGTVFNQYAAYGNLSVVNYLWQRTSTGATIATANAAPAAANVGASFTITTRANASLATETTYTVTITTATVDGFIQAVAAANVPSVTAQLTSSNKMTLRHELGGDMLLIDGAGTPLANVGLNTSASRIYATPTVGDTAIVATNWKPLEVVTYTPKSTTPFVAPESGTLWYYNTPTRVDIMINNGSAWVGYQTLTSDIRGYNLSVTNDNGPILSTTAPTKQDDLTSLEYGDLWLDTSDLENYPKLYRWQSVSGINRWVLIDNSDVTGQNGIVFADARWASSGNVNPALDTIPSIVSLLTSNYVDVDAPDPTLYPRGMLLWNTRASGYNVKEYRVNYFNSQSFPDEDLSAVTQTDCWVTSSGFDTTGVPYFGRKAPRNIVVTALKSAIDSSTALREDANQFNLISCPGYPELIPNMIALNEDRENTAFIIGDTPLRLIGTGTEIQAWAQNSVDALATGEDGLATVNPYVAVYYPHGQTNDLSGTAVVVPASHAVLRVFLKSDNLSYPWLAPAGTRRGLIDNLNAIGYLNDSGQFISIGVTQGLRDVLYSNKINPLTFLPSNGLLVYGQKTLSSTPSALDRINVSRLVNYLRLQLNNLAQPFIFEPNDPITRNSILTVVNSLLNDLVVKRGITDYLAVCDTSNNTPERIARNELYLDVAIQPTKDVEFIYIPIRLKNPGEIQAGNLASASAVGTGA